MVERSPRASYSRTTTAAYTELINVTNKATRAEESRVSSEKRRSAGKDASELTDRMADAVTYLSRVADEAGMDQISADLLSIRKRLVRGVGVSKPSRGTDLTSRNKARKT